MSEPKALTAERLAEIQDDAIDIEWYCSPQEYKKRVTELLGHVAAQDAQIAELKARPDLSQYKCPECDMTFMNTQGMKAHRTQVHK